MTASKAAFELPSLLIVGAQGQLGYELEALAREQGFEVIALNSEQLDLLDERTVTMALQHHRPRFVVNAAAKLAADGDSALDYAVNNRGAAILAEACRNNHSALVHVSCAELFGDQSHEALAEDAPADPITRYGKSKLRGEELVRAALSHHLIVRTGWLFSARGNSFVRELLEQARQNTEIEVAEGLQGEPTPAGDLARVILAMIKQLDAGADCWGTYHYAAAETVTWFGFAEAIVAAARQYEDVPLEQLLSVPQQQLGGRIRPANNRLNCDKILSDFGIHRRPWRSGLMQVVQSYYNWTP